MRAAAQVWNDSNLAEGILAVLDAMGCANTFAVNRATLTRSWSLEAWPYTDCPRWWPAIRADACNPVQIKQVVYVITDVNMFGK
jgi:hypothetical protein